MNATQAAKTAGKLASSLNSAARTATSRQQISAVSLSVLSKSSSSGGSSKKFMPVSPVVVSSSSAATTAPPAPVVASFLSAQGQKSALMNVGNWVKFAITGKPMGGFFVDRPNRGILETAAAHPFATAAAGAAGWTLGSALYGAGAAGKASVAASAGAGGGILGSSALRRVFPYAVGAGAGVFAASIFGSKPSPQTQGQTQNSSVVTNANQYTSNVDNSIRTSTQDQYVYNTLSNSPYGTLGGSPSQYADLPATTSLYPSQSVPVTQDVGQSAEQSQGTNSWLVPALIVGAALLWSKN